MMTTTYELDTNGDPIDAVQDFLAVIWQEAGLHTMLVPAESSSDKPGIPVLIDEPNDLTRVNPFIPVMSLNAARKIPALKSSEHGRNMAALLRPCEMRALIEMVKHDSFTIDDLLTISTDCLGTFPESDFSWRADRKGSASNFSQETLQFARQGGIMAYRYRSACQLCQQPDAASADINIGIIGLPVRRSILINAKDKAAAEKYQLAKHTSRPAGDRLIEMHSSMLAKLAERHVRTQERVLKGLGDIIPTDIDDLIQQFKSCGDCSACLDNCPICETAYPHRGVDGNYLYRDMVRWLISCAGCGMCEQACPNHQPLSAIFNHLRQQLAAEYAYQPGISLSDPLPVH